MGACWGGTLLLLSLLTLSLPLHPRCALPSDKNSAAAARHLLARGVCVQVAPHVLDLHLQVTHGAGRGALEGHVLQEVRGAVAGVGLVAASRINPHAHSGGARVRHRLAGNPQAVGQPRHLGQRHQTAPQAAYREGDACHLKQTDTGNDRRSASMSAPTSGTQDCIAPTRAHLRLWQLCESRGEVQLLRKRTAEAEVGALLRQGRLRCKPTAGCLLQLPQQLVAMA
jgi:hypothetical protein